MCGVRTQKKYHAMSYLWHGIFPKLESTERNEKEELRALGFCAFCTLERMRPIFHAL